MSNLKLKGIWILIEILAEDKLSDKEKIIYGIVIYLKQRKSILFSNFAVQTRKQEITEKEYSLLTEDERRFYQRNLTKKGNYSLNQTAKQAGVKNFDKFHNAGYKGL